MATNEVKSWAWDKCPQCGSTKRVAGGIAQELIKKGRSKEDAYAFMHRSFLLPPSPLISFTTPMLISAYDVCADCGNVYCVKCECREVLVQEQAKGTRMGQPI